MTQAANELLHRCPYTPRLRLALSIPNNPPNSNFTGLSTIWLGGGAPVQTAADAAASRLWRASSAGRRVLTPGCRLQVSLGASRGEGGPSPSPSNCLVEISAQIFEYNFGNIISSKWVST